MTHTSSLAGKWNPPICSITYARLRSDQFSDRAFIVASAAVFVVSSAVTIAWCASMSTMPGMPMPGGWTMSMMWMRMPGQTWTGATASFVAMWVLMMAAMMLPSLVPMLWRYRRAVETMKKTSLGTLTALVTLGYFFVWSLIGLAVFPMGLAMASAEMRHPALAHVVPVSAGVVVFVAGALQFTSWKAHHLAGCREAPGQSGALRADAGTAWRQGVRFGLHCSLSCANLTAILLVSGVMNLRAMAVVTVAITAERLAPKDRTIARTIGAFVLATGLLLIVRAANIPASDSIAFLP